MTENTQHWSPIKPPTNIVLEPWRIRPSHNGTVLLFVVPGYTHFICGVN